ncbi:hypothetical protein [Microcoleus sp. FACHB-68]|uniref:hypothetical protein n=1 Tax=Microcoleus sp. FACHB-68 TaxID=2692826 RepID=UPI00168559CF|nr:hypothetical protein [Microcoleus sp. FACHB-68]MBD1939288.1 hypothetical protein [Microcoleus sp. FACHB-68]
MFSQFFARYPAGGLISELLTIDHGKYVVRALVVVEGVTLSSGMAAAETVEVAEDRAKTRALNVLGIEVGMPQPAQTHSVSSQPAATSPLPAPLTTNFQSQKGFSPDPLVPANSDMAFSRTSPPLAAPTRPSIPPTSPAPASDEWLSDSNGDWGEEDAMPAPTPSFNLPEIEPAATEPLLQGSQFHREGVAKPVPAVAETGSAGVDKKKDLSNEIAKIKVELERLHWSPEQGKNHLTLTYGKSSSKLLTDDELLDFLHYLESLPAAK